MKKNNDALKVSIITVCFNSVKTIERTIQSVIEQIYPNIEYIIIDGQSVDGTLEIIKKYKKYIDICVSEPDEGIYDAMNKGIRKATGDIIGILNSDDRYDIQTVGNVVRTFQQGHADVVYGDEMLVYENGYMQRRITGRLEGISYRMNISHPTVFVKKEIYEKYGMFDIQYKIAADYDFLLRVYNQGVTMQECPGILAYFRMDGFSARNGILCASEARMVAIRHLKDEEKEKYLPLIEEEYKFRVKRFQVQADMKEILEKNIREKGTAYVNKIYGEGRKKYIFGAGSIGREVYEFALKIGIKVEGFLDNDEKKAGTEYLGKIIRSLVDIKDENPIIIVSVLYGREEIKEQLRLAGYKEGVDFILYEDFIKDIKKAG